MSKEYTPPEGHYTQKFYCNSSALVIEITSSGMFAVIAPFKEKKDGNNTYDWDKKDTYFLSLDEVSNLAKGAQIFAENKWLGNIDVTSFNKFCASLFEKDNYKSLTLCHDYSKTAKGQNTQIFKYFGLEAYVKGNRPGLNFVTKVCSGTGSNRQVLREAKFFFASSQLNRFIDFLKFVQTEGFRRGY